jgi:hypothetical protein
MMRTAGSGGVVSFLRDSETCAFDTIPQQFVSNATRERVTMLERKVDLLSIEKRMFVVLIVIITAEALVPFLLLPRRSCGKEVRG